MINQNEILKSVTFLAPPITIHQADRICKSLRHVLGNAVCSGGLAAAIDGIYQGLRRYDLGHINLIQSGFILGNTIGGAYADRDDRVLEWLHELVGCHGLALCSPMASAISADSKFCQQMDCEHAGFRNQIETLRMRLHLRFALRKLGQDETKWDEHVESLDLAINDPHPVRFNDRRFHAATEVMARELVKQYSGGKHE